MLEKGLPAGKALPPPLIEHKFKGVHPDAVKQLSFQKNVNWYYIVQYDINCTNRGYVMPVHQRNSKQPAIIKIMKTISFHRLTARCDKEKFSHVIKIFILYIYLNICFRNSGTRHVNLTVRSQRTIMVSNIIYKQNKRDIIYIVCRHNYRHNT